ncbi:hypothetical protein CDIK_1067 [Cucumispora dikerogammari]|nr:hypothetical protein CDIK_1067 [Cucumispora dikerogammari]
MYIPHNFRIYLSVLVSRQKNVSLIVRYIFITGVIEDEIFKSLYISDLFISSILSTLDPHFSLHADYILITDKCIFPHSAVVLNTINSKNIFCKFKPTYSS